MTKTRSLLGAALMALAAGAAQADQFVIAHPGLSLSPSEIREVFLGDKQFAGSTKLNPVDNAALQAVFLQKVLKLRMDRYETTWAKKSFRDGVTPPAVRAGDFDTLEFVRRTPGGIGYVSGSKPPEGVVVIIKF